jgi:monofunctional biosynthetic peptidoglycan transglycosylase
MAAVLAWAVAGSLGLAVIAFCALRFVDPIITGVQLQRRVEAHLAGHHYRQRYEPIPLTRMSPHLAHAVVAAEDTRFFRHAGIDPDAIEAAWRDNRRRKRFRGGSTITQQVVKNLFFTTYVPWLRKPLEIPLALIAEVVLPKQRILELYLNVAEWGPGVFGAEGAARYHYGISAAKLSREQSARLAACLPAPRSRRPQQMARYASIIQRRMTTLGW